MAGFLLGVSGNKGVSGIGDTVLHSSIGWFLRLLSTQPRSMSKLKLSWVNNRRLRRTRLLHLRLPQDDDCSPTKVSISTWDVAGWTTNAKTILLSYATPCLLSRIRLKPPTLLTGIPIFFALMTCPARAETLTYRGTNRWT